MVKNRERKKAQEKPFTKGELNKITDAALHPLYKQNQGIRLLDGLVHGLIEENPRMSVKKFLKYQPARNY